MSRVYICDDCGRQRNRDVLFRETWRYIPLIEKSAPVRVISTGRHICELCLDKKDTDGKT